MKRFIQIANTEVHGVAISANVEITAQATVPVLVDDDRRRMIGRAGVTVVPGGIEIEWDGDGYIGEYNWGASVMSKHHEPLLPPKIGGEHAPQVVEAMEIHEISVDSRYWPPLPVLDVSQSRERHEVKP